MQLKYRDDITWQDMPRIERPFFAKSKLSADLSRPHPRISRFAFKNPLSEAYKRSSRDIDPSSLKRLYRKIEQGSVLLVLTTEYDVFSPAFIWKEDPNHKDKGQWQLSQEISSEAEFSYKLLLTEVKKPGPRGGVSTASSEPLFPGANWPDTGLAAANTVIDNTNTITNGRVQQAREEHGHYPGIAEKGSANPYEIKKLPYDEEPYGDLTALYMGLGGMVISKRPPKSLLKEKINSDGLAYRSDLPEHLFGPNGFKSGKLHGTHNQDNAIKALSDKGATYKLTPTSTKGISDLQYKYFDDTKGKYISGQKTVYDPQIYSDEKMLEMSQNVGNKAFEMYKSGNPQKTYDIMDNGVNMRAYINIDPKTQAPYIGNVHPVK